LFTHSALTVIDRVAELLAGRSTFVRDYSVRLGVDVGRRDVLPGLLLAYSHIHNPGGKVVFSTRSEQRIVSNVATFAEISAWPRERLVALREFFDQLMSPAATDVNVAD